MSVIGAFLLVILAIVRIAWIVRQGLSLLAVLLSADPRTSPPRNGWK
jgi:hypothetical protein